MLTAQHGTGTPAGSVTRDGEGAGFRLGENGRTEYCGSESGSFADTDDRTHACGSNSWDRRVHGAAHPTGPPVVGKRLRTSELFVWDASLELRSISFSPGGITKGNASTKGSRGAAPPEI